jgi:MSHA pilin protein MshD
MNMRTAQRGLTLIELVASIVIISVATIGLMAAVTAAVGRSADPMIQNQATAIGVAYMEEITLAPLCDPAYNPDGNASTTCRNECNTNPCSGGCGGSVFGAEAGRSAYDDVCDYNGLSDSGAKDRQGNALTGLSGYTVNASVLDGSGISLGSPALTAASGRVVRIEVQVSHPMLSPSITLVGYKANLE